MKAGAPRKAPIAPRRQSTFWSALSVAGAVGLLLGLVWATPASAAVTSEFFGLSGWEPPESEAQWEQLEEARIGTWRAPLFWWQAEPDPPTPTEPACDSVQEENGGDYHCFQWGDFDQIVERAAGAGMRVVPYLAEAPDDWGPGCRRCPPLEPEDREHWAFFVEQARERYGAGGDFWDLHPKLSGDHYLPVEWWQVWNEPNFNTNWCHQPGNADCTVSSKEYGALVKDTCNALKDADCATLEPGAPGPKVLLAGLPETFQANDTKMITFLRNVYKNVPQVKRHFQGVALHPFAAGKEGVRGAILRAKDAMKDYGGWNYLGVKVPILITEFAWATNGPSDDTCPGDDPPDDECRRLKPDVQFRTDKEGQRSKLKKTFRMLASHTGDYHLERAIWFGHRDHYDDANRSWPHYTGLFFRSEYQPDPLYPKPAWCGYIEIVNEFLPGLDPDPPYADCTPP